MWKTKTTRTNIRKRHTHRPIYETMFALAMSLGITPKKLAKFLNREKVQEYAKNFSEEIRLKDEKMKKDLLDKLNKKG